MQAQYVYTIKADSVLITNSCDTAELIIENHTQTVPGFLYNKGRGRTEFRRIIKLNDSTLVLGGAALKNNREIATLEALLRTTQYFCNWKKLCSVSRGNQSNMQQQIK